MTEIKSICVYCGSHPGELPDFVKNAREFGELLGKNDVKLIYGGGTNGIMGAVAEGAKAAGGRVTGIIPDFLMKHEANDDPSELCDELIVTEDMHGRKRRMFEEADAFMTLPGGIGTLEEVIEIMTWAQLGRHTKPIGFLNTANFWSPLFDMIDRMRSAGFIHAASKVRPIIVDTPGEILPALSKA